MNRKDERANLVAAIATHLPALEQRVRKQELAAVVDAALDHGDVSPMGFLGLAEKYEQLARARHERLQALRAEYEQAHTPSEHAEVLARYRDLGIGHLSTGEHGAVTVRILRDGGLILDALNRPPHFPLALPAVRR